MNQPPDTKKGAIPLDAAAKKVAVANASDPASETSPERASEAGQAEASKETSEPTNNDAAAQICPMLSSVYNMARDGHVKAMMICFIDDSGVPQLGYYVGPNQAVPMLGGVMMAEDALKEGAKRTMQGYSDFLRKKAEHDAKAQQDNDGDGEPKGKS